MARGTRSGRAGSAQQEDQINAADVDMDLTSPLKRKSPDPSNGLEISPAKRTRSQLSKSSNPLSPSNDNRVDTSVSPNAKKQEHDSNSTRSTRGSASALPDEEDPQQQSSMLGLNGRRTSTAAARTSTRIKNKPTNDRTGKQDHDEKEDGARSFKMDLLDDEMEEELKPGVLGRKKKREILGVLIAMETQPIDVPSAGDSHPKVRTRLVKVVDAPFNFGPSPKSQAEQEGDVKLENGTAGKARETTLRKFLLTKEEEVTVERFLDSLSSLAVTLLPPTNLPNPFAEISTKGNISTPIPEPTAVATRLLGSKIKQEKEMPIYEHLQAVKDVVLALIPGESTALPAPVPKHRWALHQRTTVPWPMPPRPVARGEKAPVVVPTDRVHLDWFTSVATTKNGKMEDVEQATGGAVKLGDEGDEDVGGLTRLQVEGYLALGKPAVVGPPDRQNEDTQRARGPKLGKTLYANASQKLKRYKDKRRETLPAGRPVGFLSHYHSFTPSFGPTYDSTMSSGGWNYDDTVDTIYAAASSRTWIESGWNSNYASTSTIKVESTEAMLEIEAQERALRAARVLVGDGIPDSAIDPELLGAIERTQSESYTATTKLQENGQLLQALARRQEARLRRNERTVTDPEEHVLASRVSTNLLELASKVRPRAVLPRRLHPHLPHAAELAQTLVSTPGAVYRGTLDPARPKAMAENYTASTRDEPSIPKRREVPFTSAAATPNRNLPPSTTQNRGPLPQPMTTPTPPVRNVPSFNGAIPSYRGGVTT